MGLHSREKKEACLFLVNFGSNQAFFLVSWNLLTSHLSHVWVTLLFTVCTCVLPAIIFHTRLLFLAAFTFPTLGFLGLAV